MPCVKRDSPARRDCTDFKRSMQLRLTVSPQSRVRWPIQLAQSEGPLVSIKISTPCRACVTRPLSLNARASHTHTRTWVPPKRDTKKRGTKKKGVSPPPKQKETAFKRRPQRDSPPPPRASDSRHPSAPERFALGRPARRRKAPGSRS